MKDGLVILCQEAYLIIILVHAGVISLEDEFLLEVHVAFIFDVFRKPLFWAVEKVDDKRLLKHKGKKQKW